MSVVLRRSSRWLFMSSTVRLALPLWWGGHALHERRTVLLRPLPQQRNLQQPTTDRLGGAAPLDGTRVGLYSIFAREAMIHSPRSFP